MGFYRYMKQDDITQDQKDKRDFTEQEERRHLTGSTGQRDKTG
jgi:hypothetical protein